MQTLFEERELNHQRILSATINLKTDYSSQTDEDFKNIVVISLDTLLDNIYNGQNPMIIEEQTLIQPVRHIAERRRQRAIHNQFGFRPFDMRLLSDMSAVQLYIQISVMCKILSFILSYFE